MTVTKKRIDFLFVGGAPAVDFVNTEPILDGAVTDLLADEDDLLRWLSESGIASAAQLRAMRGASWLSEAKALRAHIRSLLLRLAEGEPLRSADLAGINDALAGGTLQLELHDGHPHLVMEPRRAATPAFLIARAAADFLVTADLARIRQCEGKGCILLFYDTTKSRTRRWCSMAGCGNRAKAAAHYRRIRKTAGR